MGFEKDRKFECEGVGWRVLKPDGTLWVSSTHHVLFSLGFALHELGYRIINDIV